MATRKTTGRSRSGRSARTTARKPPQKAATPLPKSDTLTLRLTTPGFTVADVEKSLAWYRDVLGFSVKERWEDKGTLQGVEMSAGQVSFMLGQDDWKKGKDRVKGEGVRMYCTTDQSVDEIAARIKASGGTLTHEPVDEWGVRAFAVEDPDGYKITIATEPKR